ncbi:ribonuclease Y [Clostridium pasteurianum DSM 525 = ATCC 6013]|uniref:Ribonuclease Y n=1 Tax=Clostridium pasteurianum DSM 525 = ATCC 6013 TaxID=1262449 RepID=A0A0H3J3Q3_CLOPA|nr:ribonuclease Y [Clostridium pasteurianum]AJA48094.1 ribonuclease Y [Clostridium pasteurianum DSM 525 = ATCC 6013]AJA52082.1 ribonuclease Y [Clostridium pasteurianum DSM 525 = ATCC 6013]AOZ75362.1 ribonuclease Y [Clostridium pasteurianum DSM 525 = ATCC 6013]AOZ79157.1 ribonuclease Y [Clostridium pasteurianum]ELP60753.1 phosphodiesterase [Clostridium pasteurianum DSM 525 = ATCC 6013]
MERNYWMIIVVVLVILVVAIGLYIIKKYSLAKITKAEEEAKNIKDEASREAESMKKESILEAKEEVHKLRVDFEKESRERRSEIQRLERRNIQREEALDKKSDLIQKREESLNARESALEEKENNIEELYQNQRKEIERLSNLSAEEAKELLLEEVRKEIKHETAVMIKDIETRAKEEADKKAREIITCAIQRCAADHVAESTVYVVSLPNDEMKGRIIGREGRNIRALETLTGIDLIIDDTPEAVILSGFDPIRREVARIALEKLILDGRIHPARIEEMVEKAKKEVENNIKEEGEQATFETGVHGLHAELIRLLGRLKYRTSYGQNVLKHSVEVSYLAGFMASELGIDPTLAKRAGLLHDIGKAVDHEIEGPHALIGSEIAKKYHESSVIVNAIGAHHGDIDPQSLEAILVQAADAISAARPGARRETLEAYIKRLEKLEEISNSYEGVEKSYAIQAGREIRIMVKPESVDDAGASEMARNIVKRIESELEYPGQIKVNVIRETRAVEYAK